MTWIVLIAWQLFALYGLYAAARDVRRIGTRASHPGLPCGTVQGRFQTKQPNVANAPMLNEPVSQLNLLQEDIISGLINFGMGKKQARQIVLENVQSLMPLDMAFNRCLRKAKAS